MKTKLLTLLLFSAVALACALNFDYVYLPSNASPMEEFAAKEFVEHLQFFTGTPLSIVKKDTKDVKGGIFIGDTETAQNDGINSSSIKRDSWKILLNGKHLVITGGAPFGTLYGVYEFLETYCGITWLDQYSTSFPESRKLQLPAEINASGSPAFAYRGIFTTFNDTPERVDFLLRCRENIFFEDRVAEPKLRALGIPPLFGSPGAQDTLYRYIKLWPQSGVDDCLSLDIEGKRRRPVNNAGPGQVCYSSPRAREMFLQQLEKFIADDRTQSKPNMHPRIYCIIQNDIDARCECQECLAREQKYGAYSGVLLEFVYFLAEKIAPKYPDVIIQTDAYMNTEKPPLQGIRPAANVRVRYTPYTWQKDRYDMMRPITSPGCMRGEYCKGWSQLGPIHVWDYWVLFGPTAGNNAGIILTDTQATDLKFYKKCGAEYVFSECEYPERVSFHALRVWLGYKLKWNPDQPTAPLLERFFNGYYGSAAAPMREIYDLLEKGQKNAKKLDDDDVDARSWLDEAFFLRSEALFAEAEKLAANNPEIQERIALERVTLDIARIRRVGDKPGLPTLAVVKQRLRNNWKAAIHRWYNGDREARNLKELEKFFQMNQKGTLGAKYPLPPELKDAQVYEITAPEINWTASLRTYGTVLADDAEAAGGKAVIVENTTRTNPETYHAKNAKEFQFGLYSETSKKHIQECVLPQNKIPTDEKYHWYVIPAASLDPASIVWASDWLIQHRLDGLYSHDGGNRYTIYISLKFQGPAYVNGSQSPNRVSCDRILAVP